MTPFETEIYKGYYVVYDENIPKDWLSPINYFSLSTKGNKYFVLVLKEGNKLVMSNTEMEVQTNQKILDEAHGDVLMIGLGINLVNDKVLDLPRVTSVETVEKYQDIIDNVPTKTNVIHSDCKDFKTDKKYDIIWFDPYDVFSQNLSTMLKPNGRVIFWSANKR